MPDGTYIMGSMAIVRKLEDMQNLPSLHLDDPRLPDVQDAVQRFSDACAPVYMHRIPALLNERSAEYFICTRKDFYHVADLAELEQTKESELTGIAALPLNREIEEFPLLLDINTELY